jgi:hypothetical protein
MFVPVGDIDNLFDFMPCMGNGCDSLLAIAIAIREELNVPFHP